MRDNEKITLPKELQEQMIKFFLKTSVLKKKKERSKLLSENKQIGDKKNES